MKPTTIQKGFIIAGLSNILGVLLFSKGFTNDVLMSAQPGVMGAFGLVAICIWGLAYIAVSKSYAIVPWLLAVFVIEKLIYVIVWIMWHNQNSVATLYETDAFAGAFFTIYGVNDFLFMLFFGWVYFRSKNAAMVK